MSDDSDDRSTKEELAEHRTDWAKERTLLAKQRTFGAWLRTGLGAVAVGFGAAQLLGDLQPRWVVQFASALMVLAGCAVFVIGLLGYRTTFEKLEREGVSGISPRVIAVITLVLLLGAALLLWAILQE